MSPQVMPGMQRNCSHIVQIREFTPERLECGQCVKMGDTWVHLRICKICGQVGCCDDSKNKHASKHYRATGHAVMASLEPEEEWMWCYADRVILLP
jgi:uncharacterized UBP type Zn finger protein